MVELGCHHSPLLSSLPVSAFLSVFIFILSCLSSKARKMRRARRDSGGKRETTERGLVGVDRKLVLLDGLGEAW